MAGHGGGAWKVAYADFVTAMMAFFMVMWITAQNKQHEDGRGPLLQRPLQLPFQDQGPRGGRFDQTTGPLAPGSKTFMPSRTPGDPPGMKRPKDAPKRDRPQDRRNRAQGMGRRRGISSAGVGKPNIFVLNNGKEQGTGTVLLFADDSGDLSDKAKDAIEADAAALDGKAAEDRDPRPRPAARAAAGGGQDVWQLSYARCMATMKYLVEAGIEADRFRLSQAGPNEPHTIREGGENRMQNSCVDVMVLPELADDYFGSQEERAALTRGP